jgi:FAD/FMN-containing dehydrogenase/ferredoxin
VKHIDLALLYELREKLRDGKVFLRKQDRSVYTRDLGEIPNYLRSLLFHSTPVSVVQPATEEELADTIRFCNTHNISVITRGTASTGFGNVLPTRGEIVLDLGFLNGLIDLNPKVPTITVQAGMKWAEVARILSAKNMALYTYPSSYYSSVGGWVATGGYGINSFGYGHLKKHVLAMRIITPTGEMRDIMRGDNLFDRLFGVEGQLGLVTRVTLKVSPHPMTLHPVLVYFSSDAEAFRWMASLMKRTSSCRHIKFLNGNLMAEINRFYDDPIVEPRPSVLAAFDNTRALEKIREGTGQRAAAYVASLLWHERVFPLRKTRPHASLLASEAIIAELRACAYVREVTSLADKLGFDMMVEAHAIDGDTVIVMPHFTSAFGQPFRYFMALVLTSLATQMALDRGAIPYGLGIWNSPFITKRFDTATLHGLKRLKKRLDPGNILNSSRYFGVKTKFFNLPGQLFRPHIFTMGLKMLRASTPLWIALIKPFIRGDSEESSDAASIEQNATLCSRCGSCLAVCPAYRVMKDESLTARSKNQLIPRVFSGQTISSLEACKVFFCLHCGACERVCQSNLTLVAMWKELEKAVAAQHEIPPREIAGFMKCMDESDEYQEMVDRW